MSLRGNRIVGIPVVLVHEGEGLIATVETKSGYTFRGLVQTAEDNMNMGMTEVEATNPKGVKSTLRRVFIRGSTIVMVIYPPLLAHAPVFKRAALAAQGVMVAGGLGRGRQAAIGAKTAKLQADAAMGGGGAPGRGPPMGAFPPRGPPLPGGPPQHLMAGPPMHMMRPPPMGGMGGPMGGMGGPPMMGHPRGPPMMGPGGMPPPPHMMHGQPPPQPGGGYGGPPPPQQQQQQQRW